MNQNFIAFSILTSNYHKTNIIEFSIIIIIIIIEQLEIYLHVILDLNIILVRRNSKVLSDKVFFAERHAE